MAKGGAKISMTRFKACGVILGISENEVRGNAMPMEASRAMRKFLGASQAAIPPDGTDCGLKLKTRGLTSPLPAPPPSPTS